MHEELVRSLGAARRQMENGQGMSGNQAWETGIGAAPPGKIGRPRRHTADARRAQLVDAAQDVFLEAGYHAATMSDIAQRAGMSKKTLYQLVASKE